MRDEQFTWLHLSDLHFGHGPRAHAIDQTLVIETLIRDVADHRGVPKPDAIFITGDIAFSGLAEQYGKALTFLKDLCGVLGLSLQDVYVVPGNHDVDRSLSATDPSLRRLISVLRSGHESLDEVLANEADRRQLVRRFAAFDAFAAHLSNAHRDASSHVVYLDTSLALRDGRHLRLFGLNTALLSDAADDRSHLYLGKTPFTRISALSPSDIVVVLSHHPCDWLADGIESLAWLKSKAHIHLCGHLHTPGGQRVVTTTGGALVQIVSGAAHAGRSEATAHGYMLASLIGSQQEAVRLRLWPRSWSNTVKAFRPDRDILPENQAHSDLTIGSAPQASASVDVAESASASQLAIRGPRSIPIPIRAYHREFPPTVEVWVGREVELALLSASNAPVVAITGIGGQGKSALATSYLRRFAEDDTAFWDWRDCREDTDKLHTQLLSIIERLTDGAIDGQALSGADTPSLVRTLFASLDGRRALLIFDNIDRYVDLESSWVVEGMAALIDHALRVPHSARLIFTCRPDLRNESDRFLPMRLTGLSVTETGQLFAKWGAPAIAYAAESIQAAHDLTNGHPLWLNLIAVQVARYGQSLNDLLRRLQRRQDTELPERLLRSIWSTLKPREQLILRCLAEAVRPETKEELGGYLRDRLNWNQYSKGLRALKSMNLLVVKSSSSGAETLELHPLVRAFAQREYSPQDRHPFIAVMARAFDRLIERFRGELERLPPYVVLEHWTHRAELALNEGDHVQAMAALDEVANALLARGYVEEFVRIALRLCDAIDPREAANLGDQRYDALIAKLSNNLSNLGRFGEADAVLTRYEESITGKSARYINLCDARCYSYWLRRDCVRASDWGERGVSLKSKADLDTSFDCSHNLALVNRDSGAIEPALRYFLHGVSLEEVLKQSNSTTLGNIGRCLALSSKLDEALRFLRKSAILLEEETTSHSMMNRGWAAYWIAESLVAKGDLRTAAVFLRRGAYLWRIISPPYAERASHQLDAVLPKHADCRHIGGLSDEEVARLARQWLQGGDN